MKLFRLVSFLGLLGAALSWAALVAHGQAYGPLPGVNYDKPNYALSPLPSGPATVVVGNPLIARANATDSAANVTVVNANAISSAGQLVQVQTYAMVGSGPATFNAYVLRPTGGANEYTVVFDSGPLTVPAVATGQILTFAVAPFNVFAGDLVGFYGQGIALDIGAGTDTLIYPSNVKPAVSASPITLGGANFPIYPQNRTYSFRATINVPSGGLRKFVDRLPGLGAANANGLGQYIPVAAADTTTYVDADYFEIAAVEYLEQMHSDLGLTRLRGYVQLETAVIHGNHVALTYPDGSAIVDAAGAQIYAVEKPHFLGPLIVANSGRPTRIKFTNLLPKGAAGNLFIPVDTTLMGAGLGPDQVHSYTDNRTEIHLHGGNTPWISDGTPHQWVTPVGDPNAFYKKGDSLQNVPDMVVPGDGSVTLYFTNQQSGRLMFYHDHAYGTTRLNVYAGIAAGYLLTDTHERNLTPGMPELPLVIQDKTFVWGDKTLGTGTYERDPLWASTIPNSQPGDLWFPHVYMPNQDPTSPEGANPVGRWDYGAWFWPIFPVEGELPLVSSVPESFLDTPVINGTAYPYLDVQPAEYRFRVLNASNDRFFNLSMYVADPTISVGTAGLTEVKTVPFNASQNLITPFPAWWYDAAVPYSLDGRYSGVPDPATRGPAMIQIGTEGGILPAPAVVVNQPVNYQYDRRNVVVLNVLQHALLLGPAERADLIVDFSKFAGKTIILYNDAPAPVPAADPRVDYYTGDPDQTATGGAPTTLPGYGPNTRTIMQIRVAAGPDSSAPVDYVNPARLAALQDPAAGLPAVFAATQPPLIVPPGIYARISDSSLNLTGTTQPVGSLTLTAGGGNYTSVPAVKFFGGGGTGATATATVTNRVVTGITITNPGSGYSSPPIVSIMGGGGSGAVVVATLAGATPLLPKAIQELFDPLGRMNSILGVELPFTTAALQTTIPLAYKDPATEIFNDGQTQLWKITHNGVDTHSIHVHLLNAQVVNRVGWDGAIRPPDANELGWKETIRMNPLEDIIIAAKADSQLLPFGLPNSRRLLDPAMPQGATMGFTQVDPATGNPQLVTNEFADFGNEYVWHCHLLGHEENDMMRPLILNVTSLLPGAPVLNIAAGPPPFALTWTDSTPVLPRDPVTGLPANLGNPANEIGFRIERAVDPGAFTPLTNALANATTHTDATAAADTVYHYRVVAYNTAGESASNEVVVGQVPPTITLQPVNQTVTAAAAASFTVAATGVPATFTYTWQRLPLGAATWSNLANGGGYSGSASATLTVNPTAVVMSGDQFRCLVSNGFTPDAASLAANLTVNPPPTAPAAPSALAALVTTPYPPVIGLTWVDNSSNETGFQIQRATNAGFTTNVTNATVGANVTTFSDANALLSNTTYYYRVRATNAIGNSAWSNTATVTTPIAPPVAPSNLRTTAVTSTFVLLAWNDNSNSEQGFYVERSSNGGTTWTRVVTTPANTTSYRNTPVVRATTYLYRVQAFNATGASSFTNVISVTIP